MMSVSTRRTIITASQLREVMGEHPFELSGRQLGHGFSCSRAVA
jgi:hypothetical protein